MIQNNVGIFLYDCNKKFLLTIHENVKKIEI